MKELISNLKKYQLGQINTEDTAQLKKSLTEPINKVSFDYYEYLADWITNNKSLSNKSELSTVLTSEEDWEDQESEFLEAHFKELTSIEENEAIEDRMSFDEAFLEHYVVQEIIFKARQSKRQKEKKRKMPRVEAQLEAEGFFEDIKQKLAKEKPIGKAEPTLTAKEVPLVASSTAGASQPSPQPTPAVQKETGGSSASDNGSSLGESSSRLSRRIFLYDFLTPNKSGTELFAQFSEDTIINSSISQDLISRVKLMQPNAVDGFGSTADSLFVAAFEQYQKGNYQSTINSIDSLDISRFIHLKALSNWKLKNYEEAKTLFKMLYDTETSDTPIELSTRWHLALIYLKEDKKVEAEAMLKNILSNDYKGYEQYQNQAKLLLNEL